MNQPLLEQHTRRRRSHASSLHARAQGMPRQEESGMPLRCLFVPLTRLGRLAGVKRGRCQSNTTEHAGQCIIRTSFSDAG